MLHAAIAPIIFWQVRIRACMMPCSESMRYCLPLQPLQKSACGFCACVQQPAPSRQACSGARQPQTRRGTTSTKPRTKVKQRASSRDRELATTSQRLQATGCVSNNAAVPTQPRQAVGQQKQRRAESFSPQVRHVNHVLQGHLRDRPASGRTRPPPPPSLTLRYDWQGEAVTTSDWTAANQQGDPGSRATSRPATADGSRPATADDEEEDEEDAPRKYLLDRSTRHKTPHASFVKKHIL